MKSLRSGFRIATVRGIPIRLHVTFLLVLPLFAYAFGRELSEAARHAGVPAERLSGSLWAWGLGIALALFASVLVHELAHSLYAVRHGGRVLGIVLLPIGGVSELAESPKRPGDEAAMALAGPAASLLLGGAFFALRAATQRLHDFDVSFALFSLGALNVSLGLFNLLPAFPMDGGRILRGLLARKRGLLSATRTAAAIGRGFAGVFALVGVFTGNLLLMAVGLFVFLGAVAEERLVLMSTVLGQVRVRELVTPTESIAAAETLFEAGERMVHGRSLALPVTDDGRIVGVLTAEALERMPLSRKREAHAGAAARKAPVVDADAPVLQALRLLDESRLSQLPVQEEGRLVGMLTRAQIADGLKLRALERSQREVKQGPEQ